MRFSRLVIVTLLLAFMAPLAFAQGAQVAFGGLKQDTSLPVEISADQLTIDQGDGSATFVGNVVIGQGDMRLSAGKVRVEYAATDGDATGRISRLFASDGVTLVSGNEAAEAKEAVYTIATATIVMTGSVILTQGANALSSERMVVDLQNGVAKMEGRVKTILKSGGN
jgi:lipopolysaccharide export system protein LptA